MSKFDRADRLMEYAYSKEASDEYCTVGCLRTLTDALQLTRAVLDAAVLNEVCAICGVSSFYDSDLGHATDCPVLACIEAGLGKT